MTPCLAYMRCSGLGQTDGDTWKRQSAKIEKFAAAHDYELAEPLDAFRDEAVPGTQDYENRPGFARLLDAIGANGIKTVLIEQPDRLARNIVVQEVLLDDMERLGIAVIDCSSGLNLADASEPIRVAIRQILGVMAQLDKAQIVVKLRGARDRRSEQRGYRTEGRKPYGSRPGEMGVVAEMYRLRRLGATYRQIAANLSARRNADRTDWEAGTIRRIMLRATSGGG